MAKIIDFGSQRTPRHPESGGREALIAVAQDLPSTSDEDAAKWAEWILASLWTQGFKVVPLDLSDDKPTGN